MYVCLVVITLNIIYETLATNNAPSEYERNIVFRFYHKLKPYNYVQLITFLWTIKIFAVIRWYTNPRLPAMT